jgi:hypothetical protein
LTPATRFGFQLHSATTPTESLDASPRETFLIPCSVNRVASRLTAAQVEGSIFILCQVHEQVNIFGGDEFKCMAAVCGASQGKFFEVVIKASIEQILTGTFTNYIGLLVPTFILREYPVVRVVCVFFPVRSGFTFCAFERVDFAGAFINF